MFKKKANIEQKVCETNMGLSECNIVGTIRELQDELTKIEVDSVDYIIRKYLPDPGESDIFDHYNRINIALHILVEAKQEDTLLKISKDLDDRRNNLKQIDDIKARIESEKAKLGIN